MTDLATAADGADILVFVVPHQFIRGLCKQLDGKVKKGAIAVSLIKVGLLYAGRCSLWHSLIILYYIILYYAFICWHLIHLQTNLP